ncbi:MAG: ATP-binding cassette domain-containing protein [Bacteroidetes bacterium]|nr:MAG: ATP-binding cassette domain-containing protein [Bacteroidota bacterium]
MTDCILRVENLAINRSGKNVLNGISFSLYKNESLAIIGPSGSGKTLLGLALAKKIFYRGEIQFVNDANRKIVFVEQLHHFKNLQHTNDLYYQQRFNSYDTEETETVAQSLGENLKPAEVFLKEMGIEHLRDERLIQLSNGENKKLQILKARLEEPTVLILDQPFIGLDQETRTWLQQQFEALIKSGVLMILITSAEEIPESISKVIWLEKGEVKSFEKLEKFSTRTELKTIEIKKDFVNPGLKNFLKTESTETACESVIEMREVSVQYGDKLILDKVNWKVMKGERWLLSGPNGAGKSTLLSLITADNPKAYANSIFLFGKKRGSGESIWDIKKKIGFISPELHLYFNQSSTCFETVASGLYDTIGLFRQLSDEDIELVDQRMEFYRVKDLRQKKLYELSVGEQRAVLLTRALVKDPPLLILDEPCQGLDSERKNEFLELINEVCTRRNKTMVFVSHYENDIPSCISHYIQLEHGRVVEIKNK